MTLTEFSRRSLALLQAFAYDRGIDADVFTVELKAQIRSLSRDAALYSFGVNENFLDTYSVNFVSLLRDLADEQNIDIPSDLSELEQDIVQGYRANNINEMIQNYDDSDVLDDFNTSGRVEELEDIFRRDVIARVRQDASSAPTSNTPDSTDLEQQQFNDSYNTPERIENNIRALENVDADVETAAYKKGLIQRAIYNYVGPEFNQNDINLFKLLDTITIEDSELFNNIAENKVIIKFWGGEVTKNAEGEKLVDNIVENIEDIFKDVPDLDVVEIDYRKVPTSTTKKYSRYAYDEHSTSYDEATYNSKRSTKTIFLNKTPEELSTETGKYLDELINSVGMNTGVNIVQVDNGPSITSNRTGHQLFENYYLNRIRKSNELQTVLDGETLKVKLIAANKSRGSLESMNVYRGGVGKWFKNLLRDANKDDPQSMKRLKLKPSYVMGLIYTDNTGKEHIVSTILSDPSHTFTNYDNTINYTGGVTSSITTNFFNYSPTGTRGYYPGTWQKAKSYKTPLLRKTIEWFRGMLAVADAEEIILTQGPINAQVGNLYQVGDFLFADSYYLTKLNEIDETNTFDFDDSMVRYPNPDKPLTNGWMANRNIKPEWNVRLDVDDNLFTRPSRVNVISAKRTKYNKRTIKNSARLNAIRFLVNTDKYPIRKRNEKIMQLGGFFYGSAQKDELIDYLVENTDSKFIAKAADIDTMFYELYTLDPKVIAEIVVSTEQFENITGIDMTLAPDDIKTSLNFREKNTINFLSDDENVRGKAIYDFIEQVADKSGDGVAENNLKLYVRDEVQGEFSADVEDSATAYREWIYDVNDTTAATTPDTTSTSDSNRFSFDTPDENTEVLTSAPDTTDALVQSDIDAAISNSAYNSNDFQVFYNRLGERLGQASILQRDNNTRGIHVLDSDWVSTDSYDMVNPEPQRSSPLSDTNIDDVINQRRYGQEFNPLVENSNLQLYLNDNFRHKFVRNIIYKLNKDTSQTQNVKVLATDVEYVGSAKITTDTIDYYEMGVVYELEENGVVRQIRDYRTVSVLKEADNNVINFVDMVEVGEQNDFSTRYSPVDALAMTFTEQGYEVKYREPDMIGYNGYGYAQHRIHPGGRIAKAMNLLEEFSRSDVNMILNMRSNTYRGKSTYQVLKANEQPNFNDLIDNRNATQRISAANINTSQPQPFYSLHSFRPTINATGQSINDTITEMHKFIDTKTFGGVEITVSYNNGEGAFVITKHTNGPIIVAAHSDSIQEDAISLNDVQYIQENGSINPQSPVITSGDFNISKVNILVPDEDIVHGTLPALISRLETQNIINFGLNEYITGTGSSDNYFRESTNYQQQINVAYNLTTAGVEDGYEIASSDLNNIRNNYGYGQSMDVYDSTQPLFQPYNDQRIPIPNNPNKRTMRELGRAFAQTKTGKTLGYAWKTIDIGETLISAAFKKARQAALAAGAVGLGGVAATAATAWAFYEIGNLIFGALQGLPELYNINRKRNEILKNGEQWEKDIIEETFWQDYGGEILEILQEVGERSPAEILGNAIWSFTLDNLTRQSQGEVMPEYMIDDSEDLDIRDDIWYAQVPNDYKVQLMQDNIDYDKVLSGYYNNKPDANVIMNRTLQLANDVYNRDR